MQPETGAAIARVSYFCPVVFVYIRQHFFFRFFWGFMAFYLLNISVDAPDATPISVAENPVFNDMESAVEILLEQVLCIEDAVPEHDDPDRDPDSRAFGKKCIEFLFLNEPVPLPNLPMPTGERYGRLHFDVTYCLAFYQDVLSPPPEV